jgi:zinc transporter
MMADPVANTVARLDAEDRVDLLDLASASELISQGGIVWVHLDRGSGVAREWLEGESGLDPLVTEALLAEETRPRCVSLHGGTLLILRGVNLNPGADPDDMVALRIWIERDLIVSSRRRRVMSLDDLRAAMAQGRGPRTTGAFVVELVHHLTSRIANVVASVEDEVDRLQSRIIEGEGARLRSELSRMRHEIIALRRYLAPQRDALSQLYHLKVSWLGDKELQELREETDRITRLVEDLDAARERAAVTQEELTSKLSDQLNQRMYVLTVVAGIFLPLGFVTGLLGINVGGVPLAESSSGFAWVLILLGAITVLEVAYFRWRRWV